MTIQDLCNLFKVSIDKSNITSYPDFTDTEICIFLNQALLSLVNTKFTGDNTRKVAFEGDVKRIADLQKLVHTLEVSTVSGVTFSNNACNLTLSSISGTFMLFVMAKVYNTATDTFYSTDLITHENAKSFEWTSYNKPWIKKPVCYIENDLLTILYDPVTITSITNIHVFVTYVAKPDDITSTNMSSTTFAFSDSVAHEVVTLASVIALENVESARVLTKGQLLNIEE